MCATGRAFLYLSGDGAHVTDWSCTLRFPVTSQWTGRHNVARQVTFSRFRGPDGAQWTATSYGRDPGGMYCRARRIAG